MKPMQSTVLLAGLAGGMAEILWVAAYSSGQAISSATVARQVTASIWPAAAQWSSAPLLGMLIHLALSIALAALAAPLLLRLAAKSGSAGFIVSGAALLLALVWVVNFFVVLPMLNPAFITLLPFGVTFASKLLFGITMGFALSLHHPRVGNARARTA